LKCAGIVFGLLLAIVLPEWTHGNIGYVGEIATRARIATLLDTTHNQLMTESFHIVRGAHTNPQFVFSNFYNGFGGGQIGPGASATITASVEYPPGTCTQIKWSGSSTLTVANAAIAAPSDPVSLSLPDGAIIGVRQFYQTASSGIIYLGAVNGTVTPPPLGDVSRVAVSGLSDQTVSCDTITSNTTSYFLTPVAIIAQTTKPAVCIVGDSIAYANNDGLGNASGDIEVIARSVGPSFGYIHIDSAGTTALEFTQNNIVTPLLNYCSAMIVEFGINDFALNGVTTAQLESYLTTIYGYAPAGMQVFQTTLTPYTTSSDSWATTANQSTEAWESKRVTFNDALRAATFGPVSGYFDQAAAAETSTDSGLWKAGVSFPQCGSPNYWTTDGVHFGTCSATQGAAQGVIDTSRIHYPYLLNRDLAPSSNDNGPVGLAAVG